jgi:transcriptional regulator with XRE-family HTH domain
MHVEQHHRRQLRAARTLAGLTQSELSTEAGFNPGACRYWEGRKDNPPTIVPESLDAIEDLVGRWLRPTEPHRDEEWPTGGR